MGCETVIGYPLIIEDFNYELTMNTDVGKILSSIKRVTNGIIIRKNIFSRFDVMKELQYLASYPENGPLLQVEWNHNLVSLEFINLRVINGSFPVVRFWNDNFPVQMRKSNRAYKQFLDFIAPAGHNIDPCSANYFDLYVDELESTSGHWYYLIAGSFGGLSLVVIIDIIWHTSFQYWWEQKLQKLEFERDKCARSKHSEEWAKEEKWRLECVKIRNEEEEFIDRIMKKTKEDPYYAPGELEKWAEQKKKQLLKRKKRLEPKQKPIDEERKTKDKKEENEKKQVLEKKEKKTKSVADKKEIKKSKSRKNEEKILKEKKNSEKKVVTQETKKDEKLKEIKPVEEFLDQTQEDELSLSVQPTLQTMKSDVPNNFDENLSIKKTAE
ncbi:unnamed protein product [Caenorhabditis brenneri]